MKNIISKLILYYGILLMLPAIAAHSRRVRKTLMDKIETELKGYYNNIKSKILRNNAGDYEFYYDYIKKENAIFQNLCGSYLNGGRLRTQINDADLDYLYKKKITIPSGHDLQVIKSICIIGKYIAEELMKCYIILNYYSSRTIKQHDLSTINRLKAEIRRTGYYTLDNLPLIGVTSVDHPVVIDALESTAYNRITFSSCENGTFQVEGEYLGIDVVASELKKLCHGQKVVFANIFGFSAISKYVTIIAPKIIWRSGKPLIGEGITFNLLLFLHIEFERTLDKEVLERFNENKINNHSYMIDANDINRMVQISYHLPSINEYKTKLIQSLRFMNYGNKITFLTTINKLTAINQASDSLTIYSDVLNLINSNIKLTRDNPKFNDIYKSMLERIITKSKTLGPNASDEKKLLNYMNSAVVIKLVSLEDNLDNTLVIGFDKYIKVVEKRIELLDSNNYIQTITEMSSEYKRGLDTKIHEGVLYIKNNINTLIIDTHNKLIESVKKLIHEIKEKKEDLKQDMEVAKRQIAQSVICGLLNVIGNVLMMIGEPICIAVGTVLQVGSLALKTISMGDITISIPKDLDQSMSELDNFLIKQEEDDDSIIDKMLALPEVQDDNEFSAIKYSLYGYKAMKMAGSKLGSVKEHLREEIGKLKNSKVPGDLRKLKTLKKLKNIANVGAGGIRVGVDVYARAVEVSTSLDIYKQKKKEIVSLDKLSDLITDRLIPFLQQIKKNLEKEKANLINAVPITLDIKQWEISELLTNIRSQLSAISYGFEAQTEIVSVAEKLDKYFEFLIKIYQRIQSYAEHKQFVDYLTNIQYPNIRMSDNIFEQARFNLDSIIKKDMIIKNYNDLCESVRLYAFPYEHLFFTNMVYKEYAEGSINSTLSLRELVNSVKTNLKQLYININDIHSKYTPDYHPNIKPDYFNTTQNAFAKWKFSDNQIAFKQLLTAVQPKELENNVLKFITANILIQSDNENQKLTNDLRDVTVEVTHLGNSHYKCDNKQFVIDSTEFKMECDYGKNIKECESCCTTSAKMYMDSGYQQLSPYATYSIKLKRKINHPNVNINLGHYANSNLNIYLVGYGQYVTNTENDICNRPEYNDYKLVLYEV